MMFSWVSSNFVFIYFNSCRKIFYIVLKMVGKLLGMSSRVKRLRTEGCKTENKQNKIMWKRNFKKGKILEQ